MRALTICQPHAHRIAIGEKRVENRTWAWRSEPTWLAIHASKGRGWLHKDDEVRYPDMAFGAVVAAAYFEIALERNRLSEWASLAPDRFGWLAADPYVEGPCCWVFSAVVRLPEPIPLIGYMGIWTLPEPAAQRVNEAIAAERRLVELPGVIEATAP
jgi:hypothetical protein